jgi:hypothetical protein
MKNSACANASLLRKKHLVFRKDQLQGIGDALCRSFVGRLVAEECLGSRRSRLDPEVERSPAAGVGGRRCAAAGAAESFRLVAFPPGMSWFPQARISLWT